MSQYHKLYTPADSAIVFIDHQPQMLFGVANSDRATLINNVTLLAKVAKEFNVPAVLTAVETESFSHLLPLKGFAEKIGTFLNFEGKETKLTDASVAPTAYAKDITEICQLLKTGLQA